MTTTTYTAPAPGRQLDWPTLLVQIGRMNVLAISGGRATRIDESTIDLPVSNGYRVRIHLAANDTYTVTRTLRRGGKTFDKGQMTDVYAEQVGDVAWYASCFRNVAYPLTGL